MMRRLLLSLFFAALAFQARSTHIVGGDFTYRFLAPNLFELNLTLYRDCNGTAQFDNTIIIGVYDRVTNLRTDTLEMSLTSVNSLQLAGSQCSPPPEICVESGTYIESITIPDNPNGYYLSWERCCRNHSVVNIDNPGATGMVFYMEMPDPALQNSSPYFLNDPLPYMCENHPFEYNFGGADPDGDSLTFELVYPSSGNSNQTYPILPTPVAGPYSNAVFLPSYSLANVCGGTVPLTIDLFTGNIQAVTNYVGIYAMAELVREFRNGVQIGCIRREIEVTVIVCDGNVPPEVSALSNGQPANANYEIYESDTVCFTVKGTDSDDSLFITYSGDCFAGGSTPPPFAQTSTASGFKQATTDFCWFTGCGQARANPYEITFDIKDNGCPLPISSVYKVNILVKPVPLPAPLNLLCISFPDDHTALVRWTDTASNPAFVSHYLLYRSVSGGPFVLLDTITNRMAGLHADTTAYDHEHLNYCYYVVAVNTCELPGANSITLCSDDSKNKFPNYIEYVTVTGKESVDLRIETFNNSSMCTFYIYRKENDPAAAFMHYQTVNGLTDHTWTDNDVNTLQKSYCYYLTNENACHNMSPESNEACTILLTGHAVPFVNTIHWTEYVNWRGGVFDYEIYRKKVSSVSFDKLTNVEYVVFDWVDDVLDNNDGRYTYLVRGLEGPGGNNAESKSNELVLDQPPLVFAPNAFTPNDDNANESWGISTVFIRDFTLRIFNRYGEVVYFSTDKNDSWDGTFRGKVAPQGVYVYDLRYNSYVSEKESRKSGTITLLR